MATQAACTLRPTGSADIPSMVEISLPTTAETGVTHERVGWPSTWTVQAPHSAMPQPNLEPFMSRASRRVQSSGVSPSTSTERLLPFTLI